MNAVVAGSFQSRYRGLLADLNHAFAAGDGAAFEAVLEASTREREATMLADVTRVSASLLAALTHFRTDSRIVALAAREIPDARLRLDHVLQMTEDAAHRTLDLIERAVPLAEETERGARRLADSLDDRSPREVRQFLDDVGANAAQVRVNLTEVMLAQGFQDLSGQILHGVRKLIGEVELVLEDLSRITGHSRDSLPERDALQLEGPAVPGVTAGAVSGQSDVDDLIAGLGI